MPIQQNVPILKFEFDFSLTQESPGDQMIKEIERRLSWTNGSCNHFSLSFTVDPARDKNSDFHVRSVLGRGDVYIEEAVDDSIYSENVVEVIPSKASLRCIPVVQSKSFCRGVLVRSEERVRIVDLHGMNQPTALEVTLNALSEAMSGNYSKMVRIHGKGLGRLKSTIHDLLRHSFFIQSFKLDPQNSGRTIVFF